MNKEFVKKVLVQYRNLCHRCLRSSCCCLCSFVKPFQTEVQFVILMHPKERRKRSGTGTGRFTHLCLQNSQLIEGAEFSQNASLQSLLVNPRLAPYVLFPSAQALNLSTEFERFRDHCSDRQPVVFIVDASWSCAHKMMKINPQLAALPRISLTPTAPSAYKFRRQPDGQCLSTVEAAHALLSLFAQNGFDRALKNNAHDNLLEVFGALVDFQKGFTGHRRRTKEYFERIANAAQNRQLC